MESSDGEQVNVDVMGGWDDAGDPGIKLCVEGQSVLAIPAHEAKNLAMNILDACAATTYMGGWYRTLILEGVPADVARRIVNAGGYVPVNLPRREET